jgi:SH3-like domain-containing protein
VRGWELVTGAVLQVHSRIGHLASGGLPIFFTADLSEDFGVNATTIKGHPMRRIIGGTLLALSLFACSGDDAEPQTLPLGSEPTIGLDTTSSTTSVPETSTTVVSTTSSTTTVADGEPSYGKDTTTKLLRVSNVSAGSGLNVRATPGVESEVVGSFSHNTWYVEPTQNTATLDGDLWREVRTAAGISGWAHADYLTTTSQDCVAASVDVLVEESTLANLDDDGLEDRVFQTITTDGDMVVRIDFGNGASTAKNFGRHANVDLPSQTILRGVTSLDLNGDIYDEIQVAIGEGRGYMTMFLGARGCDIVEYRNNHDVFQNWSAAGSSLHFACIKPGTDDVEVHQILGTFADDGNHSYEITRYAFNPTDGFTKVGGVTTIDQGGLEGTYTELCGRDY